MRSFWRHSILYLTAAQVVGVAALVGLVFVFLTTQVTDIRTQTQFTARLGELLETVESTVQIACFAKDEALAAEVTNGLLRNSEVLGVVITSGTVKLGEFVDADLGTRYDNLYVCDCSVIPVAWGLPPTLTLLALGDRLEGDRVDDPDLDMRGDAADRADLAFEGVVRARLGRHR